MSLSGSKKRGVDEATLVAESWAELAHDSAEFSPYREYQNAKQQGKDRHQARASGKDKPAKYKANPAIEPVEIAPQPSIRLADSEKQGSFNTHHHQSIKKYR